jgi:hypothetical protein
MHEGSKVSEFCYSFNDGEFYTIFYLYGWVAVVMVGEGAGYTLSIAEH